MVLKPMAGDAHEPVFSMGDDSPLPTWPVAPVPSTTTCASASPRSRTPRSPRAGAPR
jgi:hypothetical protein